MMLALVQYATGSDLEQNTKRGLAALDEAAEIGADLVVFPELSFTPFFPQKPAGEDFLSLAEEVPGPTVSAFQEAAARLGVVVVLNLYERDQHVAYDTSPVIDADGRLLGKTRMMHITDYACFHESGYYTPGQPDFQIYSTAAGQLGVAICYDRHYPEYMRTLGLKGAELVVVPQAGAVGEWPEGLFEAELRVAAFQNGYFAALANRVGREDCLEFDGGSYVVDPEGRIVAQARRGSEQILYADIDLSACKRSHARRLFLNDRRPGCYPDLV
jgi:N-carbamoylputrescine amidase